MQVNRVIYEPDFEKKSKKELNRDYLQVKKIFDRKVNFLLKEGLLYPSLNTKKTEPKTNNIWEFYITRKKYRCFFRYDEKEKTMTIMKIGNHL